MAKVYVVTSGEYSDYGIDSIFSNIEAAEKRCATWDGCDDPNIEEYELEDGTNIVIDQVYRGLNFGMSYRSYDDNEAEKIIYDRIAKWKAERIGL